MTNLTQKETIEAHEALDKLELMAWSGAEDKEEERLSILLESLIRKALPRKPETIVDD